MMKSWARRAVVLVLTWTALTGIPSLAESQLEPPELERFVRWGPLRVSPQIRLTNIGSNDNIFLDPENKVSDLTATLAPKVEGLLLLGSRAFVTFSEELGYTIYKDNTDQNFLDHRGKARITLPSGGWGLYSELELNKIHERPVDQSDVRTERDEQGLGFGVILEPGWRTEIEVGRTGKEFSYSDPDFNGTLGATLSQLLDREERGYVVSVRYRLRGRTQLTLDGLTEQIDFDTAPRDSDEWRLMPGVQFGEGGALSGSLRVGRGRIRPDNPTLRSFDEIVGDVQLIYRFSSRTRALLKGRRVPGFAISGDSTYFLDTTYELRTVHYLNRIFGIEAGGTRGTLDFPESITGISRNDRTRSYDGGIRLRLGGSTRGQRIEYSMRLGRWRRDSNVDSLDLSRATFSIGAIVGF